TNDVATADVFNPNTKTFSPVGSMTVARESAGAAPLPDGRVIVMGGYSNTGSVNNSEIFDPKTNSFSPGPTLPERVYAAPASVTSGGRILLAGGEDETTSPYYLTSAFVFNPSNGTFGGVGPLATGRYGPAGASLPQGRALVAGGYYYPPSFNFLTSAE